MKLDVSVVIPFTTSNGIIQSTLQSLAAQKGVNFEVLAIANPKRPSFPSKPHVFYPLTFLHSAAGANNARNLGLQNAQADIVVFLDVDCIPDDPFFLARYHQLMGENTLLTGGGGLYTLPATANIPTQAYHFLQISWLYQGLISSKFQTKNLLGGNLVLRKSKLNSEYFDPTLKFGGTEREFLFRLYLKGHQFRLWPEQVVLHNSQIYFFQLAQKALAQGRGARYILNKLGAEISHDLYLKRPPTPQNISFALKFYDLFFQIGHGASLKSLFKQYAVRKLHHIFSALLITKSLQESKERRVL